MKDFSIAPYEIVASFVRNRHLIGQMIKREVIGRYRGSVLGLLWSFFNPIFMLAVYTFVFSFVFNARWGSDDSSRSVFALVLFSGLLIFNFFAESVTRAPTLIISNANYVKKVVFPLETLPWVVCGSALFHAGVSFLVWLIFYTLVFGFPKITLLLFPIIIFPHLCFTMGIVWFLASVGTYLRDVGHIVGILVTALMFLTPIFYPLSAVPERFHTAILFNPLTVVTEETRNVLIWGTHPDWIPYIELTILSILIAWFGFAWFQKTRRGFADVL